ncbi:MAG: DUF4157 domain-containing protein [Deltaproteobacteria bacterium]|nr:DUF4157 domain-containing protein [Deltaproteobacteria bacterium]
MRMGLNDDAALEREADIMGSRASLGSPISAAMDRAFGADFSDVRVHEGGGDAAALGALAYTGGSDVHFRQGAYDPGSRGGQELLGHELAHVVQQRQGAVSAFGHLAE